MMLTVTGVNYEGQGKMSHFKNLLETALGGIRTPDLMVRSHALYPTELRARTAGRPAILARGSF